MPQGYFGAIQPFNQDDAKTSECNPAWSHRLKNIFFPVLNCSDFYM